MNKGKCLSFGDTIGIVAPSGPTDKVRVEEAKQVMEALGFNIVLGESCYTSFGGYLAGTPESRAININTMFADPSINAILCLRGGYGSTQLLNLIDYELIKANPKLFIGYSDITALHIAFQQRANLATIHGPMAISCISWSDFTKENWLKAAMNPTPLGVINNPKEEQIKCLIKGTTKGKIIGGNLSLLSATMGTPYEIDTKGKLLFIEEVNEEPYRIDRMLTQLALARKFSDANGIILGSWNGCNSIEHPESFNVKDIVDKIIVPFGKPMIWNLQAGHDAWNVALPFGVDAKLDATNCKLEIQECVVRV